MRKSKFTPDQIVRMLREAELQRAAGKTIAEVCQGFGISDQTMGIRSVTHRRHCLRRTA